MIFLTSQYGNTYAAVIFGALAHSVRGKGDYSSIIETMKNVPGYPYPFMATDKSGELKLTAKSFKTALNAAVEVGILIPNLAA